MAVDRWFFGGGAEHTPESARRAVYASTSGATGVGGTSDLQVLPLAGPGQGVRVTTGSALIRSNYVGGETQTYMGTVYTEESVSITPTGSASGRSDLIVLRVEDPYAAGSPYEAPPEAERSTAPYIYVRVISGVPAGTKRLQDVPGHQNDSAETLARIDLPASTGTVTTGLITDLRQVAQPKKERHMTIHYPTGATGSGRNIPSGKYADWPLVGGERPMLDIPEWATKIRVVAYLEGCNYHRRSSTIRYAAGTIVRVGDNQSQNGIITRDVDDSTDRFGFAIIGELRIPPELRGTSQPLRLQAVRSSAHSSVVQVDYQTCVSIDVEFSEEI